MTIQTKPRAAALHWQARHHRFTPHFHTDFAISLILRGHCRFTVGDASHDAAAGQFSLINPFDVHTAHCGDDLEYRVIYCGEAYLEALLPGLQGALLSFASVVFEDDVLFDALRDILETGGAPDTTRAPLAPVLRDLFSSDAVAVRDRVDGGAFRSRVAALFERRAAEPESFSIAGLSAELGLSPAHFSRLFHRHFGVPAVFYRNQIRLERAAALIGQGASPADVAFACGFSDQSHFTRELKKARGLTPRSYSAVYRALD